MPLIESEIGQALVKVEKALCASQDRLNQFKVDVEQCSFHDLADLLSIDDTYFWAAADVRVNQMAIVRLDRAVNVNEVQSWAYEQLTHYSLRGQAVSGTYNLETQSFIRAYAQLAGMLDEFCDPVCFGCQGGSP